VTRDDKRDPFEGGIGGTGIVGILTEFGSLRVNGLRVELTGRTRVLTPFGRTSESALAQGQPLTIVATRTRDRLVARHVQITYPLVGTVADGAGGLSVNGVPVRREPGALGRAEPGARVAVSGVWTRGGVVASRFDPADDLPDLLAGVVERAAAGLRIGGVPVQLEGGPIFPRAGTYLTVVGRYEGGAMDGREASGGRFVTGTAGLRQLSVEGYLEPVAAEPGFRVAGLGHSFARDLALAPLAGRRVAYFGPYDGRFGARAGYVLPESFAARRALLGEGFTPALAARAVPIPREGR
jgi:hypothetical protein